MTLKRKAISWPLILIATYSLITLACFNYDMHVIFDPEGDGSGVAFMEITLPADLVAKADSDSEIIANLQEDGWEDVRLVQMGDGRAKLTGKYTFGEGPGDKPLSEMLDGFTFSVVELDDGSKEYTFQGTADFTNLADTWRTIEGDWAVNGITIDAEIVGLSEGEQLMSAQEVQSMIASFGDPAATIRVTLPGHSAVEAAGGWTNASAYLSGSSESAEYVWRPGDPESVSLLISRQEGGLACHDYCQSLDPIGLWLDGDFYPSCSCDCGPGNAFFANQCIACDMLCTGEGQSVIEREGQPCGCLCEDPGKKWDQTSGECVAISGDECNLRDGCQPELGENCQTCSDCGCGFEGDDNFLVNSHMRCEPKNEKADIRGCVYEEIGDEEMLAFVKQEYDECTNAWLFMLIPNLISADGGTSGSTTSAVENAVMSAMSGMPIVTKWQGKSGCIPTGGVVVGQEASDPMVCLMEYCGRVIGGAIRALEGEKASNSVPVLQGTGTKIRSMETPPQSPDRHYQLIGGRATQIWGGVDLHGDRPGFVTSPMGNTYVQSEYEIRYRPDSGMEIYLFGGQLTHHYFDTRELLFRQETLTPGEMLSLGTDGLPLEKTAFDLADLDPWWQDAAYLVDCPENSHQEGADCFCDNGFLANPIVGECVEDGDSVSASPAESAADTPPVSAADSETRSTGSNDAAADGYTGGTMRSLVLIAVAACCCATAGSLVLITAFLARRKRNRGPNR